VSEEKFSKCGGEEKNVSVEFRVFGKKRELKQKKKFKLGGKKIKVFSGENQGKRFC
jgi:hypothetical protein